MAELLLTDGSRHYLNAKEGVFSLKEMYKLLNCSLVEAVYLSDGRIMWIDEEGKFTRPEEMNLTATMWLHRSGGSPVDFIAGPALITSRQEVE